MLLQVGVERQHHERQVHIDQPDDYSERREQQTHGLESERGKECIEAADEHRLRSEDDHPRIDADEKVAPERQDHQQHQQIAMPLRAARNQHRQRIADQQTDDRSDDRIAERLEKQLRVQHVGEEALIVLERQVDRAAPILPRLEQRSEAAEFARDNGTTPRP